MGADNSVPKQDWHVDPIVAYETESWELNAGAAHDGSRISLFRSKKNEKNKGSLERSTKYLRTLRHPCIVRHIVSFKDKGRFSLVTEVVTPLDILLAEQKLGLLEVIAGLYNLLQALEFLHDRCKLVHNNVCSASLFVCNDQSWKLAGFELAQAIQTTVISPEEVQQTFSTIVVGNEATSPDVRAFAELAIQLLQDIDDPDVLKFLERLQKECLAADSKHQLTCQSLCTDSVFRNDFLEIRSFLHDLILKSSAEKEEFFKGLTVRLRTLQSQIVACHLSPLLLSRVVFLDPCAAEHVLPYLLRPKPENSSDASDYLLPCDVFREFLIPQLIHILNVHDRHVRLVLLQHFPYYMHLFTNEELSTLVLPQVLLGVRDVNDDIVAASLHALSKMVVVLGAEVVVGKNRQRFFTEGKPGPALNGKTVQGFAQSKLKACLDTTRKQSHPTDDVFIYPNAVDSDEGIDSISVRCNGIPLLEIPERSSPDGGESVSDDDNWSDWNEDITTTALNDLYRLRLNSKSNLGVNQQLRRSLDVDQPSATEELGPPKTDTTLVSEVLSIPSTSIQVPKILSGLGEEYDIMAIDDKQLKLKHITEDDFFADMEPTITNSLVQIELSNSSDITSATTNIRRKSLLCLEDTDQEVTGWDDSELHVDLSE